jgi:hypothetical protein
MGFTMQGTGSGGWRMKLIRLMGTVAALGWALSPGVAVAADAGPGAAEIAAKAFAVNGGEDSRSRLTFTFHKADGSERKLAYVMAWKNYPPGGDVSAKAIFFSEFPPDDKGKAYMIWLAADRGHQDDEWMYLPELRMVRKITHDRSHRHQDKEDDFARSLLVQVNLVPREPDLDNQSRLADEVVDGHSDYVIDSVPKQPSAAYPYLKTRRWISRDDFLTERIDYYSEGGEVKLRQLIKWQKIGDAWVWKQVLGFKPQSEERTVLDVSDVRVNNHFQDELFSARSMRLGKDSLDQ